MFIDFYELVGQLCEVGLSLLLLVCFLDILQDCVCKFIGVFDVNIECFEYQSCYIVLYLIKVNQQEVVVENIIVIENVFIGLEVGFKLEFMVVLVLVLKGGIIVCNGYKDCEFIKLVLMGQKFGYNVFIVIEKEFEVQLVIEEVVNVGVQFQVGLCVWLFLLVLLKWVDIGGEKVKFGFFVVQLLLVVECFCQVGFDQGVCLLYFYMGLQIVNLVDYQYGFKEVICYYGELCVFGLLVDYIDVGGGFGVDYDGIYLCNVSLINYDIDDYVGVVVGMFKEFCDVQGLLYLYIFLESGWVLIVYYVVLIIQVIDVEWYNDDVLKIVDFDEQLEIVCWLVELFGLIDVEMVIEIYWCVIYYIGDVVVQYVDGKISLVQKVFVEQCYFVICWCLYNQFKVCQCFYWQVFDEFNDKFVDKYICNFLVFQSLLDIWVIGQVLLILLLYCLGEELDWCVVLQDLICDFDGKIIQYVDEQSIEISLLVYEVKEGEDYLIGVFLVGVYQEIFGDMYNLFGDIDLVNVYQCVDGGIYYVGIEIYDIIEDMLCYVYLLLEELMIFYCDKVVGVKFIVCECNQYLDVLCLGLICLVYLF